MEEETARDHYERAVEAELRFQHHEHLHPLERIVAALAPHFELGPPLRGAWFHRWDLGDSLRAVEEEAIVRGTIAGDRRAPRRPPPRLTIVL